jgi:hypothetical protein
MDARVKNLREWVVLLFFLFCTLDIAALQYGIMLGATGSAHPNPVVGQIVSIMQGSRGAWRTIYVTPGQGAVFYAFLGAACASLLVMLSVIVTLGIKLTHSSRSRR